MASRLYWIIIDDEDENKNIKIRHSDYVYIVHRDKLNLKFAFSTKKLAIKCASRLKHLYPDESDSISIEKLVIRTDYK